MENPAVRRVRFVSEWFKVVGSHCRQHFPPGNLFIADLDASANASAQEDYPSLQANGSRRTDVNQPQPTLIAEYQW